MSQLVIVVSGPGGVGKGTVVRRLVDGDAGLVLSRSWTTRAPRPGEAPDAYTFVDEAEFLEAIDAGRFLEWNHFLGVAYYGSPTPDPGDERDLVLEIDVNGARQIVQRVPEVLLIFVDTPSTDEQRLRLVGRGDSDQEVERRMAAGEAERVAASELPYVYVVNDDVDRAAGEIGEIIAAHRTRIEGTPGTSC